jgi:molybdate transport system substrate-binding protein
MHTEVLLFYCIVLAPKTVTTTSPVIRVISSMATQRMLADLVATFQVGACDRVSVESVGGIEATRRVEAGESFDIAVLAAEVIERLVTAGIVVGRSRRDLVRSSIAVAVPAGEKVIDIGSEATVRRAVRSARSIGYSTGPSGEHLMRLFERWGVAQEIRDRLVQAPPGLPVGQLVAEGKVDLGFQQFAELIHVTGIVVLGLLPQVIQSVTIFSAVRMVTSTQIAGANRFIDFLASPMATNAKLINGMAPV